MMDLSFWDGSIAPGEVGALGMWLSAADPARSKVATRRVSSDDDSSRTTIAES
jgi:hypothetical protein